MKATRVYIKYGDKDAIKKIVENIIEMCQSKRRIITNDEYVVHIIVFNKSVGLLFVHHSIFF